MRWRTRRVTLGINYARTTGRQRQPHIYLRQRQQPSAPLTCAAENETFHKDNARTVQTPSIAEVLNHGVDVIAIQRQLERAPHDPQAQKWHVSLRKRPRSEMRTKIRRAAECAMQRSRCHATGSEV